MEIKENRTHLKMNTNKDSQEYHDIEAKWKKCHSDYCKLTTNFELFVVCAFIENDKITISINFNT